MVTKIGIELNSPIDIHAENEGAFAWSCCNGYLQIAKWLYKLGIESNFPIDIHANNEFASQLSCKNGHLVR